MNIRIFVLLLLLSAGTAHAEMGRLFFTPAQRATLDNARKQNIRIEVGSDSEQPAAPVAQNISVNGVIRSSDGRSTVWINNRPVNDKQAGGVNVSTPKGDNRVTLTVPDSGRRVDLKVGQTVEIVSGTIADGYSRRSAPRPDSAAAAPGTGVEEASKAAPGSVAAPPKRGDETPAK